MFIPPTSPAVYVQEIDLCYYLPSAHKVFISNISTFATNKYVIMQQRNEWRNEWLIKEIMSSVFIQYIFQSIAFDVGDCCF